MADNTKSVTLEDATLIFRNFEGKEGLYNDKGDRNFGVLLDEETAKMLAADNWNVKVLQDRDEDIEPTPWMKVKVSYKNRPPRIVMIAGNKRTNLDEDTVETLDWANIKKVDLICNGYEWEVSGKTGVKAYLKTMFVTIEEDYLERKYNSDPSEAKTDG